ncbi:VCBS domain-containing protein, partial [Colwelliaceae bacterium BS250]
MKNSDKDNQDIKKNNNKTDEKNVARHAEQKIQDKVKQLDKEAAKLKTKEFRYDNKDSSVVNEDLVAGRVSPHVLAANAAADENVIADDVTKVTETVEDQAIENVQTNVEVNIEPINEESAVAGQANIEQQVLLTRIGKGGAVSQEVVPTFPDGSLVTNGQPTSQTGILTGGTGTLAVHNITFNSPNVGTNVTGPGSSEHVNSSGTPLVSTTEPLEFAPSSQNTNVKENASVDTVSGDLNVTGTLAISASFSTENSQGQYGSLVIDPKTGEWNYHLDNTLVTTDALSEGEHHTEQFVITATDENNNIVKTVIHVEVEGTNDLPVISGLNHAAINEFGVVNQVSGALIATDPDHNETLVWHVDNSHGQFGELSIDEKTGQWQYNIDNKSTTTQQLASKQQVTEHFIVTATDSSGKPVSQQIDVLVTGSNELPIINGVHSAELTENVGNTVAAGQLTATDPDNGEHLVWQVEHGASQYGHFNIDANTGIWQFEIDNTSPVTQSLAQGQSVTEHFLVKVTDSSGTPVMQEIAIKINGTEQHAQINGTSNQTLTEDKALYQGLLRTDGQLTVTDPDAGENQFTAGSLQGQFGTLSINNNGHWTYTADNSQASIQGLNTGESLQETLVVHSVDGTEQKVTVTINGTDDKAVIAGTAQALITEDKDVRQGQLHADGQLTVTDLDAGENQFTAGTLQGQFGTLAINNNGHWTYTADNSQASIQGLNTGESLQETLIVHSIDGTEQKITVTINGTDDKAVIAGTAQALITEDKDVRQGQLHADGQLTVTD